MFWKIHTFLQCILIILIHHCLPPPHVPHPVILPTSCLLLKVNINNTLNPISALICAWIRDHPSTRAQVTYPLVRPSPQRRMTPSFSSPTHIRGALAIYTVTSTWHFDQIRVFALTNSHHKRKVLWPQCRAALTLGVNVNIQKAVW